MRDLYSKTNAPYLIAGAVATLVLLALGHLLLLLMLHSYLQLQPLM
ncbi:hypothetical protein [Wolbachia endosymbiont (group A) of Andrena bucephala]